MAGGIVQGSRSGAKPISSIDDAGTERLAVDAKLTSAGAGFVSEVNLDAANDEVSVYGSDGGTPRAILVDASGRVQTLEASGLVPKVYDFIDCGYDGSNRLTSVVYKTGGSGGTTVATLAITYIGTTQDIDTVTRT